MAIPIRVLILEDRDADTELMVHELRQAGYDPAWQRVETEQDFLAHLDPALDLILSDYVQEHLDASRALQLLRERKLDIPFILVTGHIDEEIAVATMRQGAVDYLFKDRPARLGPAVANALERKRLREERHRADQALETLAALSAVLRTAQTREEILSATLGRVIDFLGASTAALDMRDPDNAEGETVVELARGTWSYQTSLRLPAGRDISGQVIGTGQSYVSEDVQAEPGSDSLALAGDIRALACVPLVTQGETLGALRVGRALAFTGTELRALTTIADIAAEAIQRTTLHAQAEQRLEYLEALHATDLVIGSSLDLHFTLDLLLGQVIRQLRMDAADVLLLNPRTHILEYGVGRGFRSTAIQRSRLRLGQGHAGQAALERRTISVADLVDEEADLARAPLLAGEDFRVYYGVPLIAKGAVWGVLEVFHRTPLKTGRDWHNFLQAQATHAAIAIDNARLFGELQYSNLSLTRACDGIIEAWSRALDLRHSAAEGHTQRIAAIVVDLARSIGVSEDDIVDIRRGALLHDVGMMAVPDQILQKPGDLSAAEWSVVRRHPVMAYELLSPVAFLRHALDIPYCHHEKWDGTGYPRGLKGEQIPLAARAFAVVDVWDTLHSDRPFRLGWPESEVWEYLTQQAGSEFDPQVVQAFTNLRSGDLRPE